MAEDKIGRSIGRRESPISHLSSSPESVPCCHPSRPRRRLAGPGCCSRCLPVRGWTASAQYLIGQRIPGLAGQRRRMLAGQSAEEAGVRHSSTSRDHSPGHVAG